MRLRNLVLFTLLYVCSAINAQEPASVFITAGQSNAEGRVSSSEKPKYLDNGYKLSSVQSKTASLENISSVTRLPSVT